MSRTDVDELVDTMPLAVVSAVLPELSPAAPEYEIRVEPVTPLWRLILTPAQWVLLSACLALLIFLALK